MIKIAVTGSIGTGKSTLLQAARDKGYPVFDADATVARLYNEDAQLIREIGRNFPGSIKGGKVHKPTLVKALYGDGADTKAVARKLRQLVGPYVKREMEHFFHERRRHKVAVCEIPFLFESSLYRDFDVTVNLTTPRDTQRTRVLARDGAKGMTNAMFEKIASLYFDDSIRQTMADVNLDTHGAPEVAAKRFTDILAKAKQGFTPRRPDLSQRPPIVWLIGATSSGKTPIAVEGVVPLGFHHVAGSHFFRKSFGKEETDYLAGRPKDSYSAEELAKLKNQFVQDLTQHSVTGLKENPHCNADYLKALIGRLDRPCVLEGFRNHEEFMTLYQPGKDMVFLLGRPNAPRYSTDLEPGIVTIKRNVKRSVDLSTAPEGSVYDITFADGKLDVRRLAKGGRSVPVVSELTQGADDYALIRKLIALVPGLVSDYYVTRGLPLRPAARSITPQKPGLQAK